MEFLDVSVLLPFRDHEHLVGSACRRLAEHFRSAGMTLEIIAVDQGSGDNSEPVLHLLRSEIPELRVISGRGYAAAARLARGQALLLVSPERAAEGLSDSSVTGVQEVLSGQLDMKLLDDKLLVCASSSCTALVMAAPSRHRNIERKLLQNGRSRGLSVRSYGPEAPPSPGRRISQVLAAVVPRSSGQRRAS